MASPHGFQRSLRAQPLYDERFVIVCAPGHRFAGNKVVRLSEMDGQSYLERVNCEYRDCLAELLARRNVRILRTYASEREDWLQIMVLAGMGVCLLPEFSAMLPGLVIRPVIDPLISRRVCLVTVADRCWSSPVAALISALRHYEWPSSRIEVFHNEGSGA